MGKAITASLAQDRRRRAEEEGAEVEALVKADPPLIKEACYRLQRWYKAAVDRAPPPARAMLKRVTAERVTLYSWIPPPGNTIPVTMEPLAVEDGVPTEAEIEWAVKCLRNNRAGGAVEDAGGGYQGMACGGEAGRQGEGGGNKRWGGEREHGELRTEDEENWERVVELVQTAFWDGDLAEEATWQTVVLIPKGKGD